MSWPLLIGLALLTYGSRALALACMPPVPPRARHVLDRMPAALFAGLAAQALVAPGGAVAEPGVLAAAAGAVVVAPLRSLPACLVAGIGAFLLVAALA